ncbi:hypothetical protein F4778DRAFT_781216 [Xylariomycetidae sp. FL2044]|nr:hypothetical protein F4778DRAFT_781216 [Xylariomycetidae sp. FL2044]
MVVVTRYILVLPCPSLEEANAHTLVKPSDQRPSTAGVRGHSRPSRAKSALLPGAIRTPLSKFGSLHDPGLSVDGLPAEHVPDFVIEALQSQAEAFRQRAQFGRLLKTDARNLAENLGSVMSALTREQQDSQVSVDQFLQPASASTTSRDLSDMFAGVFASIRYEKEIQREGGRLEIELGMHRGPAQRYPPPIRAAHVKVHPEYSHPRRDSQTKTFGTLQPNPLDQQSVPEPSLQATKEQLRTREEHQHQPQQPVSTIEEEEEEEEEDLELEALLPPLQKTAHDILNHYLVRFVGPDVPYAKVIERNRKPGGSSTASNGKKIWKQCMPRRHECKDYDVPAWMKSLLPLVGREDSQSQTPGPPAPDPRSPDREGSYRGDDGDDTTPCATGVAAADEAVEQLSSSSSPKP